MRKTFLLLLCLTSFWSIAQTQQNIDNRIEELLSKMTLRQKIGQMNQQNARKPDEKLFQQIRAGEIGSILNAEDPEVLTQLQKIAVEESDLGIPIIFARDVIHGYKTIFPIPLAQAASFNPEIVEEGAHIAAVEASEKGIRWTFAPMMDISRDPRWGRIAESFGEDVFLSAEMAKAMVQGFQGKDLSLPTSIAACAKHFVGYGAVEGGRDYNITYIPERQLRTTYLPPFEKAIQEAGCATIMTAFNANNGIPPSANKFLLTDILRKEWKFDGVVVSDWGSVSNMVSHGFCENKKEAARKSVNAGLDMEMVSGCFIDNLEQLVAEGKVSENTIDNAVRNILRLKFKLGLFEKPYINKDNNSRTYASEFLQAAKKAAEESFVLLKNDHEVLPLSEKIKTVAVIGPLADSPHDQMGTWVFDGEKAKTQTPLQAFKKQFGKNVKFIYEQTLTHSRDKDTSKFDAAVKAAGQADVVLLFIGEESILSGEAHSLADLHLVGAQSELLETLSKTGKPIVTIIMAGRPLSIGKELALSDAVLYAWHPGTMGGPALADVIFGKSYPSGKLPVTFPKYAGQIPVYYNHEKIGRPANKKETLLDQIPVEAKQSSLGNTSYYLDADFDPLFHFGDGLSYTTFEYKNLKLSAHEISDKDTLVITAEITNTGKREGCEVAQLYASDLFASVSPLVKQLKGFQRITIAPKQTKIVEFSLPASELALWDIDMKHLVEPGTFEIMLGGNSQEGLKAKFTVLEPSVSEIIDNSLNKATAHAIAMAKSLEKDKTLLPRSFENGKLITSKSKWWCSGFFPGTLWYLYENNADPELKKYALEYTDRIKKEQYTTDHHDVGFMIFCSFGNGLQISNPAGYKEVIIQAAKSLSTRYKEKTGVIRSWDKHRRELQYPVIIDNMMNLELLMWAAKNTGNESFRTIAMNHADKTMKEHFRPDFSCYHLVDYDGVTGLPRMKQTVQGYSDASTWARGEAWALYGYTMMYRETGEKRYLLQAENIARFILNNPHLPKDKIPYWDFDAPDIPYAKRDASAAAVMASAFIELSTFTEDNKLSRDILQVAKTQIINLSSPEYFAEKNTNGNFILKHSVGHLPAKSEIDVPLTYADYYYVEAMMRYKQTVKNTK